MRQFLGSAVIILAGIVASVWTLAATEPYLALVFVAATVVGVVVSYPFKVAAPSPARPSSFVDGDADGSTFNRVSSNADSFVRGNARESIFNRVRHRRRRR